MEKNPNTKFLLDLLQSGNVRQIALSHGSPYTVTGTVIHGNHLGRKLGFPTANLEIKQGNTVLPSSGVYAVLVTLDGIIFSGMANIGIRPTFGGKTLTVEVHIFDLSKDLYGAIVEVSFIDRIRDEKKFTDLELLINQLKNDQRITKELIDRWCNPDAHPANPCSK